MGVVEISDDDAATGNEHILRSVGVQEDRVDNLSTVSNCVIEFHKLLRSALHF